MKDHREFNVWDQKFKYVKKKGLSKYVDIYWITDSGQAQNKIVRSWEFWVVLGSISEACTNFRWTYLCSAE